MQRIGIDELGLSATGLTIIGGRPAMGKTSFLLSLALDMVITVILLQSSRWK